MVRPYAKPFKSGDRLSGGDPHRAAVSDAATSSKRLPAGGQRSNRGKPMGGLRKS